MEEVDKIILQSLLQIGCDIDENITSLKQFDTDMIVKAAVSCLRLIQPGLSIPSSLPHNMAARYRVGQDIAQACMDSGYSGDIGYQTFLYSGESDVRRVLMFLIEKIPKEQEKFAQEPTGSELVLKRIKCKVKEDLSKPWLPHSLGLTQSSHEFLANTDLNIHPNAAWKQLWQRDLPMSSLHAKHLIPTLVTLHSRGILAEHEPAWFESSSVAAAQPNSVVNKFSEESNRRPVKQKPPIAAKPKLQARNEAPSMNTAKALTVDEVEDRLKSEEHKLTEEIKADMVTVEQLLYKKSQLEAEIEKEGKLMTQWREKDVLRARIAELLPGGEDNVSKLQQVVEASAQRLVALASQWEKLRVPLLVKYRQLTRVHSTKINENVKKAESAKTLSEKRRELEQEMRSKEKVLIQLQEEYERIGKEANRSAYTRRILEIIGNMEKQKVEVEKVLRDTRALQKEINSLSGQLERSFTVADETIFRDAKKDEASRRAYKLLATLHTDCDQLVAMVQETGAILKEIRDLEEQIEKEKSKNIGANLERITADLRQMKVESAQLSAQLRIKQKGSAHQDVEGIHAS